MFLCLIRGLSVKVDFLTRRGDLVFPLRRMFDKLVESSFFFFWVLCHYVYGNSLFSSPVRSLVVRDRTLSVSVVGSVVYEDLLYRNRYFYCVPLPYLVTRLFVGSKTGQWTKNEDVDIRVFPPSVFSTLIKLKKDPQNFLFTIWVSSDDRVLQQLSYFETPFVGRSTSNFVLHGV